ncbi:hypothetical protein MKX01_019743, partial [Papaver californicum]
STSEEQLWSIVKSNSLDFNAWTALIEETEMVAENSRCVMVIGRSTQTMKHAWHLSTKS